MADDLQRLAAFREVSRVVVDPETGAQTSLVPIIEPLSWRFALQTPDGLTVSTLPNAENREMTFRRNTPGELTFELDHDADDAYRLMEQMDAGVPIVRAWRIEPQPVDLSWVAVCRFSGQVMAIEESTSTGMAITARMPPARLEHLYTAEVDDHPFEDAGSIGQQLVEDAPFGAHRLTVLTVAATVTRDLTYENRQRADALRELTEFLDGFDFDVIAVGEGTALGRLVIARELGILRPGVKFGYGEGTVRNCVDATRRWLPPINEVRAIGDDGVTQTRSDPVSQGKYDLWQATTSVAETVDADALGARAQEMLSGGWRRFVTFNPDPWAADAEGRPITPVPGLHYWLGDRCPVEIRKGAWRSSSEARIDEIKIGVGADALEHSHAVSIMDDQAEL